MSGMIKYGMYLLTDMRSECLEILQDNPNRADTLFEDAIEYDDNYNDFSNGMNGLCTHWKEDSRSPKAFNHRQRLSESLHERLENGEEGPPSPPSPPSEGTAGSRAFPSTWGELLNGHSTPVDHNPVNASEERGHVPDSWESLAPESSFASLSRYSPTLRRVQYCKYASPSFANLVPVLVPIPVPVLIKMSEDAGTRG